MSQVIVYTTEPCASAPASRACCTPAASSSPRSTSPRTPSGRAELARKTGMMSFPQVIVDGELLGGFTEVQAAAESGRLDEMLAA